jgi:hypothetical protein
MATDEIAQGGGGGGKAGQGGFGPGAGGSDGGGGGGGPGAGGDVFVQQGGVLLIEGGTLAAGGGYGGVGGAGDAFGNGLFIQGTQDVTLDPLAGQTLTISGVITDETGSTGGAGGHGRLIADGPGTVVLSADNSFTGGITIGARATLDLMATGAAGSGAVTFDGSADLQIAAGVAVANTIDGFAGADLFDLRGIAPGMDTTATLNAGDTLTVTDGTHTETLHLAGAYTTSDFHLYSDGSGGTVVKSGGFEEVDSQGTASGTVVKGVGRDSVDGLVFDGFAAIAVNSGSGSYWASMPARIDGTSTPLTPEGLCRREQQAGQYVIGQRCTELWPRPPKVGAMRLWLRP